MVVRILLSILITMTGITLCAQPFTCTGDFILAISTDGDSTNLFNVEVNNDQGGTILFENFTGTPSPYLNAVGYRWTDNYLYGIGINTHDLYRVDASGAVTFLHHFDEFDPTKSYNAGDVSIDGKYLVVLSGVATNLPWRNEELILIDLEDPDYNTVVLPLTTLTGELVYSLDIAFDPITGVLYGFDGLQGRLIKIIISNGDVDNETFPPSGEIDLMAALFFDSFGNLYGYAKHLGQPGIKALYKIDIETGEIEFLLEGPQASGSDGCSCPYRLELLESVEPTQTVSCTEVEYTFVISNASFYTQNQVEFQSDFPLGFELLEVSGNTYGGQINGINSSSLTINNMSITSGVDSFKIKIAIGDVVPDNYENQSVLTNLSASLGDTEYSDDPATIAFDDPTNIEVEAINLENIADQFLEICPGDTLLLDVNIPEAIFSYIWDDGTMDPIKAITAAGIYQVIIENNCETFITNYTVNTLSNDINLELGADRVLSLGDGLLLNPQVSSSDNLFFQWSEFPGNSISCNDCKNQDILPLESSTFQLIVTDENGCTDQDQINITVNKNYQVFASNIFSPNGDGVNDLFYIQGKEGITIVSLKVFNRWGGLNYDINNIFVNDKSKAWDGKIKGEFVPSGVYVWSALIRFIDGEEQMFTGDVTVVY